MSKTQEVTKPLIEPIYSQAVPSEPIELGLVNVQFTHGGNDYSEAATVAMRFTPKERLSFVIPMEGKSPLFGAKLISDDSWDGKLLLVDRNVTVKAFCVAVGPNQGGMVFEPNKSGVTVTTPSHAISTATIHLFNFPEFSGPDDYVLKYGDPPRQGSRLCGRVVLNADGWLVTIAATGDTYNLVKALKTQGGYVITHVGSITREDGTSFSSDQLDDLLGCVYYFLSFALGRWAGPTLPVGFDAEGNRVFEQWGMRMTADGPWYGSCAWFDLRHSELLTQVFPGFLALWRSELWRHPLTKSLYWYLGACDRRTGIGVDTGLILAQTALELLAWSQCVLDRKMVSQAAFKPRGLTAADKLRLLASSLDIPLEIPSELSGLHGKPGKKWSDSMDAITGIRNALVHPDVEKKLPEGSCYDACRLALWYIDLTLLRLCGHSGTYANRLAPRWVGELETVPWAPH